MKQKIISIFTITLMFSIILTDCKKEDIENKQTVKQLYKIYKNGEISECKFNGVTVYSAALNAYDASTTVFDKAGKQIGSCNYAYGNVDSICIQLTDCEVFYRVKNNI